MWNGEYKNDLFVADTNTGSIYHFDLDDIRIKELDAKAINYGRLSLQSASLLNCFIYKALILHQK